MDTSYDLSHMLLLLEKQIFTLLLVQAANAHLLRSGAHNILSDWPSVYYAIYPQLSSVPTTVTAA